MTGNGRPASAVPPSSHPAGGTSSNTGSGTAGTGPASILSHQLSDLSQSFGLRSGTNTSGVASGSNVSGSPTAKQVGSLLSRASSLTSSVSANVAGVAGRLSTGIKEFGGKTKILLVIDDAGCDWTRYFRGRRLAGENSPMILVEQAHFAELAATAHTELGVSCAAYQVERGVPRPGRHFRPDFVLVRQHVVDAQRDSRPLILALQYAQVPSMNSLHSVYNFVDRPWVYSQLIAIQRRLGKAAFPLIEQTFYANYREMLQSPPRFPCVIKMGHSHGGLGKLRAESPAHFQELLCALACVDTYLTVEPYVDAKCDVHVQKIGANYKAFMRKSISGNWKSNMGSAMLEQCPITEQHRKWLDEIAQMFNGLDVLTIEIVQTKDDQQFIYEVTGSQMTLMGETQEEDRRLIADLVVAKMQQALTSDPNCGLNNVPPTEEDKSFLQKMGSISGQLGTTIEKSIGAAGFGASGRRGSTSSTDGDQSGTNSGSNSGAGGLSETVDKTAQQIRGLFRRSSQTTGSEDKPDDGDDTMKNLRKTFAGIFGEN